MNEICPVCGTELAPVTTNGWVDMLLLNRLTGKRVVFYGIFSKFEGLTGTFGWIEYRVPPGLFCPYGHIGISEDGREIRRPMKQAKLDEYPELHDTVMQLSKIQERIRNARNR